MSDMTMHTRSPYDVQVLGAKLGNARRNGATEEQVEVLQAALRVGQIEVRIRRVLDGAEPLDEAQATYLVNLVIGLSVKGRGRGRPVGGRLERAGATEPPGGSGPGPGPEAGTAPGSGARGAPPGRALPGGVHPAAPHGGAAAGRRAAGAAAAEGRPT